jgi:hypothetical protein
MPVQDTLDALPFPLTGCDERCLTTPVLRLWDAANGPRAARDRGGSDPTATVTHRASKGGVLPPHPRFGPRLSWLPFVSSSRFFSISSLLRWSEVNSEVPVKYWGEVHFTRSIPNRSPTRPSLPCQTAAPRGPGK